MLLTNNPIQYNVQFNLFPINDSSGSSSSIMTNSSIAYLGTGVFKSR